MRKQFSRKEELVDITGRPLFESSDQSGSGVPPLPGRGFGVGMGQIAPKHASDSAAASAVRILGVRRPTFAAFSQASGSSASGSISRLPARYPHATRTFSAR